MTQEAFRVIPAVDLLGDEAVRLERGNFGHISVRAEPAELIARFAAAGAPLIHLVDLDGARGGHIRTALVRDLAEAARPASLQASGGVRALDDAEALLAAGAARVVVGTAVCIDPAVLERFAAALGDRLVVAVDVRAGNVAVRGWTDDTGLEATAFARRCAAAGVKRLLCTAIERDGMLDGPDVDLFREIRAASGLPVLAAGGIRSSVDLDAVADSGCEGAIVGRALLDGSLPLDVLTA